MPTFCAMLALFSVLARFRFLVRNTNWFLGSVLWNVIIQIGLVLTGLAVHHLWVPMLGIGWVVVDVALRFAPAFATRKGVADSGIQ